MPGGHTLEAQGSAYAGLCAGKDLISAAPKCPLSKYLVRASCRLPVVGPQLWVVMEGRDRGTATSCPHSHGVWLHRPRWWWSSTGGCPQRHKDPVVGTLCPSPQPHPSCLAGGGITMLPNQSQRRKGGIKSSFFPAPSASPSLPKFAGGSWEPR